MDRATIIFAAATNQCFLRWNGNIWHYDWDRHVFEASQAIHYQNWASTLDHLSLPDKWKLME